MKSPMMLSGQALLRGCLLLILAFSAVSNVSAQPVIRLPTNRGTPALIPAGPNAEAPAKAAVTKVPTANDAATNPTEAEPGVNPPINVDGNFLVGPVYVRPPELTLNTNVPQGKVRQFSMDSAASKFYPGIGRKVFGTVDPKNPKTLIVETNPAPYHRTITVYVPSQYVPGTEAPLMVTHDGPGMNQPDMTLPRMLDNMIAQHRLPAMILVMIANGGGDAQGSQRGLE